MFFKKYAVTDRNTMGWYIEARTIKEIASHVNGADQYVIAVEYGKPRPLTDEEEAELQLEQAKQRRHWFWG
jgi:hypothetical protein